MGCIDIKILANNYGWLLINGLYKKFSTIIIKKRINRVCVCVLLKVLNVYLIGITTFYCTWKMDINFDYIRVLLNWF